MLALLGPEPTAFKEKVSRVVLARAWCGYIRIGPYVPWLGFDAKAWSQSGVSPLWIDFAPSYSPTTEIEDKLLRFSTATPQRCFDFAGQVSVPIFLTVGVEKQRIVKDAVRQIGELANELSPTTESALSGV